MGSSSPTSDGLPGSLRWEHRVLATGPPEKSLQFAFLNLMLYKFWKKIVLLGYRQTGCHRLQWSLSKRRRCWQALGMQKQRSLQTVLGPRVPSVQLKMQVPASVTSGESTGLPVKGAQEALSPSAQGRAGTRVQPLAWGIGLTHLIMDSSGSSSFMASFPLDSGSFSHWPVGFQNSPRAVILRLWQNRLHFSLLAFSLYARNRPLLFQMVQ